MTLCEILVCGDSIIYASPRKRTLWQGEAMVTHGVCLCMLSECCPMCFSGPHAWLTMSLYRWDRSPLRVPEHSVA